MHDEGSAVAVGIDAAVVANHHIVVRRAVAGGPGEVVEDFVAAPTLSGLATLTKRLAVYPGGDGGGRADVDDLAAPVDRVG